ncbi:hypothetical protein AD949_00495 [Acetobacter orleanensis]|nr:hypothetical protein AD949_00495 [Acetobacter orleanensis]
MRPHFLLISIHSISGQGGEVRQNNSDKFQQRAKRTAFVVMMCIMVMTRHAHGHVHHHHIIVHVVLRADINAR